MTGDDSVHVPVEYHAAILVALYAHSRPVGMGALAKGAFEPLTEEEAQRIIDERMEPEHGEAWMDYVRGRPIKVGFGPEGVRRADLYDRDNGGPGLCARIIAQVLGRTEPR